MELISKPIDDLESLLGRAATRPSRRVPLRRKCGMPERPRILVCHDMQGGYLHDRYVQGCNCPSVYTLVYHQLIDVFVYFSHHLVTVPPAQWIDLCHQNGIPVLGTFITEGESGAKLCERIFHDENIATDVASALGHVANAYQFDGWLINIENTVNPSSDGRLSNVEVMSLVFLPALKSAMCDGSQLIWYDAVTVQGNLWWQNRLNDANLAFFDICDGIFLNYNWTTEGLANSRTLSVQRPHDVYVGVDVFARDKCTIGCFDTPLAVRKISGFQMSAALFAPGWVMECLGEPEFINNQTRFWKGLARTTPGNRIEKIPFSTCFCTGRGTSFHVVQRSDDQIIRKVYNNGWSYLPMTTWIPVTDDAARVIETDAFIGGSCLEVEADSATCIANLDVSGREFQVSIATKSGRIVILLAYRENEINRMLALPEQNAFASYTVDEWLWRKHLVKLDSAATLTGLYVVADGDSSARLGLLTLERPERENNWALDPSVHCSRRQNNRLYVIVKFHNPEFEIVNAFVSIEENRFVGSTTGEYMCLLFELLPGGSKSVAVKIEFSKWMLDAVEHVEFALDPEDRLGNAVCHIGEEDEQLFNEMFRSVG